jgi:hypothetical protein
LRRRGIVLFGLAKIDEMVSIKSKEMDSKKVDSRGGLVRRFS